MRHDDHIRLVVASPDSSSDLRAAATEVVRALRHAGFTAYFAGGCVRDELLGRTPSDYDVATDALPDRVRGLFKNTAAVGASFGVILVKIAGAVIEVATFRADGSYSDARRPDSVTFSTADADAHRRDFTVNALFLDPLAPAGTGVIDFVGGQADLKACVLRAVGDPDQRLAEDHLRALRAVRLSAKLGFAIEAATAAAIRRHASDLRGVSRERIGDELRQIFEHPSRARAVERIHELGLEGSILDGGRGDVPPMSPRAPRRLMAAISAQASPVAALACWIADLFPGLMDAAVPGIAGRVRQALCLSNTEDEALSGTLKVWLAIRERWSTRPVAERKRLAVARPFTDALAMLDAEDSDAAAAVRYDVAVLAADGVGLAPAPVLTGDDLIAGGARPGPKFRTVLDRVYDAQLEGRVAEKGAAMELARSLLV